MIAVAIRWTCKPGHSDAVLASVRRMAQLVKQHQPDCTVFQVSRSLEQPDLLFLYEVYADQAAIDAHIRTDHFERIVQGDIFPRLESRVLEKYELVIP